MTTDEPLECRRNFIKWKIKLVQYIFIRSQKNAFKQITSIWLPPDFFINTNVSSND